jgi:hypothetical protein
MKKILKLEIPIDFERILLFIFVAYFSQIFIKSSILLCYLFEYTFSFQIKLNRNDLAHHNKNKNKRRVLSHKYLKKKIILIN